MHRVSAARVHLEATIGGDCRACCSRGYRSVDRGCEFGECHRLRIDRDEYRRTQTRLIVTHTQFEGTVLDRKGNLRRIRAKVGVGIRDRLHTDHARPTDAALSLRMHAVHLIRELAREVVEFRNRWRNRLCALTEKCAELTFFWSEKRSVRAHAQRQI